MAGLADILAARVGDGRSRQVGRQQQRPSRQQRRPSHVEPQLWNRRPAPSRGGGPRDLNAPPPQPEQPPRRPNPGRGDRLQPMPFNPNDSAGRKAVPMSYAGEQVQPQMPPQNNLTQNPMSQLSEQELIQMLFAAYQDRNMSGRNKGSRGFRGKPVTGI